MIGTQELVMIFAVILLLFGASKLPELARSLGKASGEFKKAKIETEEEIMNLKHELEELRIKNEQIIDDVRNYLVEKLNSIEEYSRNRKIYRLESSISALDEVHEEKIVLNNPPFEIDLNIDESK